MLGFTFGISLLAGGLFGLVPALQSTRPPLANTLKDQAGAVIRGGSATLRKGLVVAQVSLSLLLLIGAGLFLQSLRNLNTLNPGFDVSNVLAFDVDPTLNRYDRNLRREYYRRLRERLNGIAGSTPTRSPSFRCSKTTSGTTGSPSKATRPNRTNGPIRTCSIAARASSRR